MMAAHKFDDLPLLNPLAVIGNNNPPEDDEDAPPTVEEARIVAAAISYVQWKAPNLEELLTKRKGGRILGWRLALANALKGRVRQNSLRKLLGYNRKTMGENQQRADVWAEYDDEHGSGQFGERMAALRHAIEADSQVDVEALDADLKAFVKLDPQLRTLEQRQREHEAAALEAEQAAEAMRQRQKERRALDQIKEVRKSLKGAPNKDAIVASHLGSQRLAKSISDAAIAVVEKIVKADAKGARRLAGQLDAAGLKECIKLGIARASLPHLAPPTDDPPIAPTDLGRRIFVEAEKTGRIKIKKKKRKPA